MAVNSKEQLIQEAQYNFPYHYIPQNVNGAWSISRNLWWGYEYLAILQTITDVVINLNPENVLDFGCGDGRLIYELYSKGIPQICGIDCSERALAFCQSMGQYDDRVNFCIDLKEIQGQLFNIAIAMEVVEHIPPQQTKSIIAGIHSILDPEGRFIISVPTKNIPLNRKHYRHFTVHDLEQEIAGLFVIERVYFVHKIGPLSNILRRAVVNRLFIPNSSNWLKITTRLYKQFVMDARECNGAHLVAVLRKTNSRLPE